MGQAGAETHPLLHLPSVSVFLSRYITKHPSLNHLKTTQNGFRGWAFRNAASFCCLRWPPCASKMTPSSRGRNAGSSQVEDRRLSRLTKEVPSWPNQLLKGPSPNITTLATPEHWWGCGPTTVLSQKTWWQACLVLA